MISYSSILLTILITCSVYEYSLGMQLSYQNYTRFFFRPRENITITCIGEEEVTWEIQTSSQANYSIRAETPRRKVFEIRNATILNAATCICRSNKTNEHMLLLIDPDLVQFEYERPENIACLLEMDYGAFS